MRRRQFTIRSLCACAAGASFAFAVYASLRDEMQPGVTGFILSAGLVVCVIYGLSLIDAVAERVPRAAMLLFAPLLHVGVAYTFYMFGELIDQPHPSYGNLTWPAVATANMVGDALLIGAAVFILIGADLAIRGSISQEQAYFPRAANLISACARRCVRMWLFAGATIVFAYYASAMLYIARSEVLLGTIWPPRRIFVTCLALWGWLWCVDAWTRPKKETIVAAVGFLVFVVIIFIPSEMIPLRE